MFNNSNIDSSVLLRVKNALGITGNFQDNTIEEYIKEVLSFVKSAGVKEHNIIIINFDSKIWINWICTGVW